MTDRDMFETVALSVAVLTVLFGVLVWMLGRWA